MADENGRKPRRRLTLADQLSKLDKQIKDGEAWLVTLRERRAEIVKEAQAKLDAEQAALKAATGAAPF